MAALHFHSDLSSLTRLQQQISVCHHRFNRRLSSLGSRRVPLRPEAAALQVVTKRKPAAASKIATDRKPLKAATEKKPVTCTADELHYVDVPDSDWRLALWRYLPSPKAIPRNHPLLLLTGIGTNALGYDLSPENSFARYMAGQGYDTWTLELRGAGLSKLKTKANCNSFQAAKEKAFGFGLPLFIDNFAHPLQLDEMAKYNWDLDNYLEEDLPAAMEYIKTESKSKDGKLLAIGHSMGGILLYATLARCCFEGRDSGLASIATLGASLDYTSSRSSLKMLLPLVGPARDLNVPAIPFGALSSARLPHSLPWLNTLISAQDTTMHSDLFTKLLKMLCTIPFNLLSQLATAFQERGLCNRNRTLFYKDHLGKSQVPILALAGDQDSLCPPEAVYETVKHIPKNSVTYRVFGEPEGPHYTHYDIMGGPLVRDGVFPSIVEFLNHHDAA